MKADRIARSLFGGTLVEGRYVRLIYVDEAGTSPSEPVRVVAGIIVHGDDELRSLSQEMIRIFDEKVPASIRDGFVFHGLEVFGGGRKINRDEWPLEERLDFFKEVVCLPYAMDIPIVVGIDFSSDDDDYDPEFLQAMSAKKISKSNFEHGLAFARCAERADFFLRKYLDGKEIGTIIAENITHNKKFISSMALIHKDFPMTLPGEYLEPNPQQQALGMNADEHTYEIRNIVDVPHFVEKSGAPLLQLADACAFSFRRYLSRQSHGKDLCLAMLGPEEGTNFVNDPHWFNGASSSLFNTEKYWPKEVRDRKKADMRDFHLRTRFMDWIRQLPNQP